MIVVSCHIQIECNDKDDVDAMLNGWAWSLGGMHRMVWDVYVLTRTIYIQTVKRYWSGETVWSIHRPTHNCGNLLQVRAEV